MECRNEIGIVEKGKTVWTNRQNVAHAKWEGSRQSLTEAMLGQFYLDDEGCSNCHLQQALINCIHCRTSGPVCGECDQELHRKKPFHDRQFWQGDFYKFLSPLQSVNASGQLIDISKSHLPLNFFKSAVSECCFGPIWNGSGTISIFLKKQSN